MLETLFNKAAGLQGCNFIKKKFQHRCFPVKFVKFLIIAFSIEHLRWLFCPFPLLLVTHLLVYPLNHRTMTLSLPTNSTILPNFPIPHHHPPFSLELHTSAAIPFLVSFGHISSYVCRFQFLCFSLKFY